MAVKLAGEFTIGKSISADRFSQVAFIICLVSTLFLSSLILVSWQKLPPELPLFYSRPWGEPMLTKPIFLWILPAISAGVVIVNFGAKSLLGEKFLARVLVVFALLVSLAAAYGGVKIIALLT